MLQPVNTMTASNSRPNSMGNLSSRPMSKATDTLYEIQPIKISVKKDTHKEGHPPSKQARSKSNPVQTIINHKSTTEAVDDLNRDDIDPKYIGNVKWQLDE